MTKQKLEVETLRTGTVIVRPQGTLGTCGWHPKAWTTAVKKKRETAEQAFLRFNPKWEGMI